MDFKKYQRTNLAEMREYIPGESLEGVSVSQEDAGIVADLIKESKTRDPKEMKSTGFIARNPDNHSDKWYVAYYYYEKNFKRVELAVPCDSENNGLSFGTAIKMMQDGHKVSRAGWNGKGIFVEIQNPDENSKMSGSYIFIDTTGLQTENPDAPKSRVPWAPSQTDMLSNDWGIATD